MVQALLARRVARSGRVTAVLQLVQGGHRFRYVRLLAENADGAAVVLFTTDEARASADFGQHLARLEESGQLLVESVGSLAEPARVLLDRAVGRLPAGAVLVVPDADRLLIDLAKVAFRRRVSHRGLPGLRFLLMRTPEMRLGADHRAQIALGKVVLVRVLRRAWPGSRALFLTDSWGVVDHRRGYTGVAAVRDPSPALPPVGRAVARVGLGLTADQFVLGLLGGVTARKHPEVTIEAMKALPGDVVLLVAGELAPGLDDSLETLAAAVDVDPDAGGGKVPAPRVVVRSGYLSDEELACCVNACDVILLTSDVDSTSGLLVAAEDAGVPVLAAGSPWVCRVVSTLGLGIVEDLSAAGVVRGVTALRAAQTARRAVNEATAGSGATAGPRATAGTGPTAGTGAVGASFAVALAGD